MQENLFHMRILIKNKTKYKLVKIFSNGMNLYVSDKNKKIFIPENMIFKKKEKKWENT